MGIGNKELVDPVVFLGGCGRFTATPSTLSLVLAKRLALNVAAMRQRNHHLLRRNEIFGLQLFGIQLNK